MRRTRAETRVVRNLRMLVVLAGMLSVAPGAFGASVKLIANPELNVDALSVSDLKSVFLGERNSLRNGSHVQPVLEKHGAAHEAFLRDYLDESDADLQLYYRTLVFTGKGAMPKAVSSDEEVIAYVARTKGAIGYVNAETRAPGVKS